MYTINVALLNFVPPQSLIERDVLRYNILHDTVTGVAHSPLYSENEASAPVCVCVYVFACVPPLLVPLRQCIVHVLLLQCMY